MGVGGGKSALIKGKLESIPFRTPEDALFSNIYFAMEGNRPSCLPLAPQLPIFIEQL